MKIGDVVKLKSGSPKMTVTHVISAERGETVDIILKQQGFSAGDVSVEWFDESGNLKKAQFKKDTLTIDTE
ncbi:MAG: YodC family protein [Gammaproteobacteria bacterium]|nr:YodC family protein [Gammaproteobacteria bacterium]MBU1723584.1 YodC family protein [Gammaproteobacteria bacterium]MBU2004239.1 YodC family protein [Gammaproteobacteria bacterium]